MYSIKTFSPKQDAPEMQTIVEKLYSPQLIPLQQASDRINTQYAHVGICVEKNGEVAGRIILYTETGILVDNKKTLVLGNYECVNEKEVAKKLFEAVENFAREGNYNLLIGPMNGTTWDTYRFCTNPEAGMFFSEMVHQPWYAGQWKENGFQTLAHYYSSLDTQLHFEIPEALKREKELLAAGIKFRNIDLDRYEDELKIIFSFCEEAFSKNFLYTPISWETFRKKYIALKSFIVPEFVWIAEDKNGSPAGFVFCFPDHICKTEKRLVLKTLARANKPEFAGLGNVFGNISTRNAKEKGFTSIIHALIYENNFSLNLSGQYSGTEFKKYELYSKAI